MVTSKVAHFTFQLEIYMGVAKVAVSSRLMVALAICLFITLVGGASYAVCQEPKTVKKTTGPNLEIRTYVEIPEATEPCSPQECEWWKQLREAGNNLQKKSDEKSRKRFDRLFVEGLEKSYRVPLPDRPPQNLASGPQRSLATVGKAIEKGTVEFSIEIRADRSIGDIKVVKGVNKVLDQFCVQNAREGIFLPAVKDHAFVTDWQTRQSTFFLGPGASRASRRF
jgi:hypothetical protein